MVCRKCRQERGDEFHRGHRQCKECHEVGQQERNRQRPAIRRWIRLKHLYNLTRESFAKLWENQSGKCAVCSVELTKPDVDHCHHCEAVRGLLCHRCNVLCGHLEDRQHVMQAIQYLDKHIHE